MSAPDRRAVVGGGAGAAALGLLTACGAGDGAPVPTDSASTASSASGAAPSARGTGGRTLLAVFSRAGENYSYGGRVDLEVGNTAVVADIVADLVDVDRFEIRAADPYPESYDDTVRRNVQEQDADARPQIAGSLPDLTGYETVMLGSGVWNVRAPMIMRTFVESVDLDGRTVLPFVTYAVSGLGRVADEYAELLPRSTVGEGLAVRGEEAAGARPDVEDWLRRTGLLD
ncbi:flavodoxin [Phycicoccus avicenniae]|uniref:flavodoxin n=1 Tax=Phycicoccus avicenniae TaxID=2828860 RepID=UPI003D28825B